MADPELSTLTAGAASLSWRATPWDEAVLGVPTVEVVSITAPDPDALPGLLAVFEALALDGGTGLATVRIPAAARRTKLALEAAGWAYVETSHPLTLAPIPDLAALGPVARRRVAVELATIRDLPELQLLAAAAFDHSRYHEDPRIHPSRARARMAAWIADTFARGDHCVVHRASGSVVALMTYRRRGDDVTLYLGGTAPGRELIAPMFWTAVLAELAASGVRSVTTRVSSANTGALRLHLALGFVLGAAELGFNRLYPNGASIVSLPTSVAV